MVIDPVTALMIANGAIATLKVLVPEIKSLAASGEISNDEQQKLLDEITFILSPKSNEGPEWQQSGRTD